MGAGLASAIRMLGAALGRLPQRDRQTIRAFFFAKATAATCDIWMTPFSHAIGPIAARVCFSRGSAKDRACPLDEHGS